MLLIETAIFYVLFGVVVAVASYLRCGATFELVAATFFWPFYLPMLLAVGEESGMGGVMVMALPGCISFKILVSSVAWRWFTAKTMDCPILPSGARMACSRNEAHMTRLRSGVKIFRSRS